MHRARVFRSTPFRLAFAFGSLFVVTTLIVFAVTYFLLRAEIYSWLDTSLTETYSVIESSYSPGDVEDLIGTMESFSRLDNGDRRVFYLGSPDGRRLAGDLKTYLPVDSLSTVSAAELGLDSEESFRVISGTVDGTNLLVGQSLEATEDLTQILLINFGWMLVFTLIIAAISGAYLTRRAQARIDAIAKTMEDVSGGDMSKRIELGGSGDDIDVISGQINAALDRISDLMEGMRQVSADIAHDLKTPLNRLKLILEEAVLQDEHGKPVSGQLQEALQESDQINATFQALLRISQIEAGTRRLRFAEVDMKDIFATVAEIYADVAEDNGQLLTFDLSNTSACPLEGDKELLTQLVINLVENAINHCPRKTEINLSLNAEKGGCTAIVSDSGPGIPEDEREKIFRRLYRLDKSRNTQGHGLGLSLVKAIADLHDMTIRVEDNQPGARFVLSWST